MRVVVRDFEKFPAVQHHDDVAEVAKATCAQCTRKSRHRKPEMTARNLSIGRVEPITGAGSISTRAR
jgi:hypothetical protein